MKKIHIKCKHDLVKLVLLHEKKEHHRKRKNNARLVEDRLMMIKLSKKDKG